MAEEAERTYEDLSKEEKDIARRVFLGLVRLGEGTRDTRRRVNVASLVAVGEDPDKVAGVLRRFSDPRVRLITLSAELTTQESLQGDDQHAELVHQETAEVTHEALFEYWGKIGKWLDGGRDELRFQRRLEQAACHWESEGRQPGLLWRRPDLDYLKEFHDRAREKMTKVQVAFYKTSRRAHNFKWSLILAAMLITAALAVTSLALFIYANKGWGEAEDTLAELKEKTTQRDAAAIMAGLSEKDDHPTENEYFFLRLLAESKSDTQILFMKELLTSGVKAGRLQKLYLHIVHAIVGLNSKQKDEVIRLLFKYGETPSDEDAINVACAELGVLIDPNDPKLRLLAGLNFVAAIERTSDSTALARLRSGLGKLGEAFSSEHAAVVGQEIGAAIGKETDSSVLYSLCIALDRFVEKLPPQQALFAAKQIASATEQTLETVDWQAQGALRESLRRVVQTFTVGQAEAVSQQLVSAMGEYTNISHLRELSDSLAILGKKLSVEQSSRAAQRFVDVIRSLEYTDTTRRSGLTTALGSFGRKLAPAQAAAVVQEILDAAKESNHIVGPMNYGEAFVSLLVTVARGVTKEQAASITRKIVTIMKNEPSKASSLVFILGTLGAQDPSDYADIVGQEIGTAIEEVADPALLVILGRELERFDEKLSDKRAEAVALQVANTVESLTDSNALRTLCGILATLGERLSAEPAAKVAEKLLAAIRNNTSDVTVLDSLCRALGGLGVELPEDLAGVAAMEMLRTLGSADPDLIASVGGLGDIVGRVPNKQRRDVARQILAAMG